MARITKRRRLWTVAVLLAGLSLLNGQRAMAQAQTEAFDLSAFLRETPRSLIERMIARHGVEPLAAFISSADIMPWVAPVSLCYEWGLLARGQFELRAPIETTVTRTAMFVGKLVKLPVTIVPKQKADLLGGTAPTAPCDIVVVPYSNRKSELVDAYFISDRRRAMEDGLFQKELTFHGRMPGPAEYFFDRRGNAKRLFSFISLYQLENDPDFDFAAQFAQIATWYGGYIRGRSDGPIVPFPVPILDHARNRLGMLAIAARSGVVANDSADERLRKVTAFLKSGAFND